MMTQVHLVITLKYLDFKTDMLVLLTSSTHVCHLQESSGSIDAFETECSKASTAQ